MKRLLVITATVLGLALGATATESKMLSAKDAKELIASASKPEDHLKLARYYTAEATRLEAEAADHAGMAAAYRANPQITESKLPGATNTTSHCDSFTKSLKEAAGNARSLAADHEAMAKK